MMACAFPSRADLPPNDNFADAIDLGSQTPATSTSSNAGATQEPGERKPPFGQADGKSVWWKWTAPATATFEIHTLESELLNTALAVYTGTQVDALESIVNNNDISGFEYRSRVFLEATAGTIYHIQVMGLGGTGRGITLNISRPPPPPNDNFADATDLGSAATVNVEGTINQATVEPGEATIPSGFWNRSVWWKWTAPASGVVEVNNIGSAFRTALSAFQGDSLATATRGPWNSDVSRNTRIFLPVIAGQTYHFQVMGGSSANGLIRFAITPGRVAPANDNFAQAIDLGTAATAHASGGNVGATQEIGEAMPMDDSLSGQSVWWKWTAPVTGFTEVSAVSEEVNAVLAVYTGTTLNALTLVATDVYSADNDGPGNVRFHAVAGQSYLVQVAGRLGSRFEGAFALDIRPGSVSATNDNFAAAIDLGNEATVQIEASNLDATIEPQEPGNFDGGASVWWKWTAPTTGPVEINTLDSEIDTGLVIYTGNSLASLRKVTANHDVQGNIQATSPVIRQSAVRVHAMAGTTYYIQVLGETDDNTPATGRINLTIQPGPTPPANDTFAGAAVLPGPLPLVASADARYATVEAGEPLSSSTQGFGIHSMWQPYASLWWKWTPDVTGWVRFQAALSDEADSGTVIAIYAGSHLNSLEQVASSRLHAIAGATYYLQTMPGAYLQAHGNPVSIEITAQPDPPPNDHLADAIDLGSATTITVTGALVNASAEQDEPDPDTTQYIPVDHSVWWKWTSPATGWVETAFLTDEGDEGLSLNKRTNLAVYGSPPAYNTIRGSKRFQAIAGATYYFQAYMRGVLNAEPGEFTFEIKPGTGELTGYAGWVTSIPGWTSGHHHPQADPDGDGLPNLLEYTLELKPDQAQLAPYYPEIVVHDGASYAALHLTFPTPRSGALPRLRVLESDDLNTWTLTAEEFDHGGWTFDLVERWTEGDTAHVRVRARQPLSATSGKLFFRLNAFIRY